MEYVRKIRANVYLVSMLLAVLNPGIIQAQELYINEFLAFNSTINQDPDYGGYSDWIEVYNAGVDLEGYYLTDDLENTTKWEIPPGTVIASGEFMRSVVSGMRRRPNSRKPRKNEAVMKLSPGCYGLLVV